MNTMTNAWAIAHKAANFWGGDAKEFFAMALKMAHNGLTAAKLKLTKPSNRLKVFAETLLFLFVVLSIMSCAPAHASSKPLDASALCREPLLLKYVTSETENMIADHLGVFSEDVQAVELEIRPNSITVTQNNTRVLECESIMKYTLNLLDGEHAIKGKVNYTIDSSGAYTWQALDLLSNTIQFDIQRTIEGLDK